MLTVTIYKVYVKKSFVFLNICSKLLENNLKIQFTKALNMEYLMINLTKYMNYLYSDNKNIAERN